jgi:hypothetical protein
MDTALGAWIPVRSLRRLLLFLHCSSVSLGRDHSWSAEPSRSWRWFRKTCNLFYRVAHPTLWQPCTVLLSFWWRPCLLSSSCEHKSGFNPGGRRKNADLTSAKHIGDKAMIDEPSASDLQKAYQILSEFGLLIGPAGKNSDAIARAIAAGIALGRKEASPDKPKKKR